MSTGQDTARYYDLSTFGFLGYRIGDDGSVWSLWKRAGRGVGGGRGTHRVLGTQWRKLSPWTDGDGYLHIAFFADGIGHIRKIHQLVLEAFVGPCPEGMQCCHNDGSRNNNALSNLRWDTHRANIADKFRHGTHVRGERNPMAKITEETARLILDRYRVALSNAKASGLSRVRPGTLAALAREAATTYATVLNIIYGRRWQHVDP